MHRIDGPGATVDNKFTEGDPVGGVQATVVTDDFLNDVQEELISILVAAGVTPVKGTQDQVLQSIYKLVQAQKATAFSAAGSSTVLTLTPTPAISDYATNQSFRVRFPVASGLNPTLNVSGKGAKALKQYDSTGAKVAAVFAAGQLSLVEYDGIDWILLDQLPAASDLFNTARVDVASAGTVNLTTAAPSTRHINITGSTTVSGFTVAVGQCYFVRFDGALQLTNSASLVTQSGGNILTQAGDTCIIRATAANIVEVLCYTPGIPKSIGYRQSWQDLAASRSLNTNYTNSTGQPIKVSVNSSLGGVGTIRIMIDGIQVQFFSNPSNTAGTFCISELVPPGSTYQVQSSAAIASWKELR